MSKVKVKITKAGRINPNTHKKGYSARVLTRGTAGYDEIVAEACRNTSLHKSEAKTAFELCIEQVAEMLKQGYIIDLGPLGKLYPSCTSGWVERAEDLHMESVSLKLNYFPSKELKTAFREALLQWAKAEERNE